MLTFVFRNSKNTKVNMIKDMVGVDNGYIQVIKFVGYKNPGKDGKRKRLWSCKCKCGKIFIISTTQINQKKPRSCGCYKAQGLGNRTNHSATTIHGMSIGKKNKIYNLWCRIRGRCYSTNVAQDRKSYRDKGVVMCDEWKNSPEVFHEWCMTNGWKQGLSIDRINNDGNYEPSNCRFITVSENSKKVFIDNPTLHRGTNHKDSKINEDDVREIRRLLLEGHSNKSIALIKNIKSNIVYQLRYNKTWKHVK